jgi:hypothetical protein
MKGKRFIASLAVVAALVSCGGSMVETAASPSPASGGQGAQASYPATPLLTSGLRNKYKWPFASDSIWNTPVGSAARYIPARIAPSAARGMTVDEDVIVERPDAPLRPVVSNDAGWTPGRTRCGSLRAGEQVYPDPVPVPMDFSTDPGYLGLTPNQSAAILMPDNDTVRQTQPLHVCGPGGTVTSQYPAPDEHLAAGAGIAGAHGGSGMSSIGGTVRVGELLPGGTIPHALKINLYGKRYYFFDRRDATPGYRWPAFSADGYAGDSSNTCAYDGAVPALKMGALLALRPDFGVAALRTEPAKILARAFIDYGAYVVDDTCWDVYALTTEWGPDGRVTDEFAKAWGFPIETSATAACTDEGQECRWARDMAAIFTSLQVVDNNAPGAVGGGGSPRRPLAPPVGN